MQTGSEVLGNLFRPPARMNWGGRPYILERPALCIGALGRIRFLSCNSIFSLELNSTIK